MFPSWIIFLLSLSAVSQSQRIDKLSIDTFTPDTSAIIYIIPASVPSSFSRSQSSTNAIGGERDVKMFFTAPVSNRVISATASGGYFIFSIPSSCQGSYELQYDGIGSVGLGGLNLLENGVDAFTFEIHNDVSTLTTITIFSDEGSSVASTTVPASTSDVSYDIFFADFVGMANFGAINSIKLAFSLSSVSQEVSVTKFGTSAPVLSPSSTPTATSTPTNSPTSSSSNTPTTTRSINPSGTSTPTNSPSSTLIIPSNTPTGSSSSTPTTTISANPSSSSTPTTTISANPSGTNSPSSPSSTPTPSNSPVSSETPAVSVVSVTVSESDEEVIVEEPDSRTLVIAEPLVFGINSTITVSGVTSILPEAIAVVSSSNRY